MPTPLQLSRWLPGAIAIVLCLPAPGWAIEPDVAATAQDPRHDEPKDLDAVIVSANPLPATAEALAHPVDVLSGRRLDAAKASSLGETVNKLPGVQSSYFGPGVGRPVIRGFDGARVQVLSDGLGSGDVSTVSADHAVSIEPFLAEQIEVLKGPATLLYGSGAIGGAVNVIDGRIPVAVTDAPVEGRAELRGGSVNDERTGMARLDGTAGNVVFHFDALHRETGNYAIPGFAESAQAHHADEPHEEEEHQDEATGIHGELANSALRTDSAALGVSWIGDRGFLGAAYSLFDTRYGVPGHAHDEESGHEGHDEDENDAADAVTIVMDQRRTELRGGLDGPGNLQTLRVKLARTGYTHTELEGDAIGTVFDNDSTEARVELVHPSLAGWDGALGVQWSQRDFNAIGAEAFVPSTQSRDAGLFWIGTREFDATRLELGVRHDRNRIDVDDTTTAPDRDFGTTSLSAALRWDATERFHVSFGLDRAQRSPSAEELYSNGPHVATSSVEVGNPHLSVETANRVELGMHWHTGPVKLGIALYHVRYADFLYLADTGIQVEHDPVRLWTQGDARFNGAEAEVDWALADNASGAWDLHLFGDLVRASLAGSGTREVAFQVAHDGHVDHYTATLANAGGLPRITPARVGSELQWESGPWRASLGAVHYLRQDHVAAHETPTPGYTLVDAHLAWHRDGGGEHAWELFLDGSNLLDAEARPHTSFLKDLAPLPGRGVAFGVRAFF